jgi:S1-C subfamily serine protease
MNKMIYAILALPFVLAVAAYNLDTTPRNTVELVEMVKGGTVLITNQIDATTGGSGTGFILKDNMIVTNDHVIAGKNNKIMVVSPMTSKQYEAEVVHTDPISDIAMIRLKDWELFEREQSPVNLTLGDSDKMTEGSKVVIIGHPWGLTWTVSEGILAAKHRRAGPNPKYMDQVDAKLFQGNSGGPVFNEKGQVVCVSNMMLSREGGSYGFCIPSNLVSKIIHDFVTLGEVRWRALNVSIGLTEDGSNVILEAVETGGAAETAGLKEGDKILVVFTPNNHPNGKKIVKTDELITELGTMHGDDEMIRMTIERDGELIMMNVKTGYKLSKEYTPDRAK